MIFLKSMTSKLSKTVSTVLIRLLDQYLLNPEICWHFKIFICGSKFSRIEIGRFRLEIRFLSLVLGSLMLKHYYIWGKKSSSTPDLWENYVFWGFASAYSEGKQKPNDFILLEFHDFLSCWLHIYRMNTVTPQGLAFSYP